LGRELDKLTPAQQARLALHDDEIAQRCQNLPPETFGYYLRREVRWIRDHYPDNNNGDQASQAEKQKAASRFDLGRRANGRWWLSGDLDEERGSIINHLINQRARDLAGQDGPTSNTRAAALFDLTASHDTTTGTSPGDIGAGTSTSTRPGDTDTGTSPGDTGAGTSPGDTGHPGAGGTGSSTSGGGRGGAGSGDGGRVGGSRRMAVGYIVDAETLAHGPHASSVAQTWDGDDIDPRAAGRVACDADLYAILLDHLGTPTAIGRTRRAATREQRLALRALYNACPLDGTPFGHCEIHHVNVFFDHGGMTDLHNLLPLSPTWHHRIHDRGWTLHMTPDRTLTLRRPNGTLERTIAPPTPHTRHKPPRPTETGPPPGKGGSG
jgi:hypothetical protein